MRGPFYINLVLVVVLCLPLAGEGQTNEFTYQGRLSDGSMPANGNYDFQFALFPTPSAGILIGSRDRLGVVVSNGTFTVTLDFPATNFNGLDRYLEIRIKPAGSPNPYTVLTPRQKVSSSPYAIQSLNAATATNSNQLGGVAANQFVQTTDPRMTDDRNPLPGSPNYIRNSGASQPGASFNIGGSGNIDGGLSVATTSGGLTVGGNGLIGGNASVGGTLAVTSSASALFFNATQNFRIGGQRVLSVITPNNTYAGIGSGLSSAGADNSFFGFNAGGSNGLGNDNSFFGSDAGGVNNNGNANAFFGSDTGDSNTSGSNNSFFGRSAGSANTTGSGNTFMGFQAGLTNTAGLNSFFGSSAGQANTSGTENSFFGSSSGLQNTIGAGNSFFGYNAGFLNSNGTGNSFFGRGAGNTNSTGSNNSFFGSTAGSFSTGANNSFFGANAGASNTTGFNNTIIGTNADVGSGALRDATAIGHGAVVNTSNTIVLGKIGDFVFAPGGIGLDSFLTNGTNELCATALPQGIPFGFRIGTCGSSIRFKNNPKTYAGGINIVRRLRPVTYNWIENGKEDIGFIAEEIEQVEPLLAAYDQQGLIHGVKYRLISTVLVNAVNEQQSQIDELKRQIEILRAALCQRSPQAAVCK